MTQHTCTGIILAGGESKRLNNVEKSNLLVGDQRIIERMMTVFEKLFSDIILVSNQPTTCLEWDTIIVKDLYTKRSSLTGIHSGLFSAVGVFLIGFSLSDAPAVGLDLTTMFSEELPGVRRAADPLMVWARLAGVLLPDDDGPAKTEARRRKEGGR